MDKSKYEQKLEGIKKQFFDLYEEMLANELFEQEAPCDMPDTENEGFSQHIYNTFSIEFHKITVEYLEKSVRELGEILIDEYYTEAFE